MEKNPHKSGEQTRKETAERFERAKVGSRTLFGFVLIFSLKRRQFGACKTLTLGDSNELNIAYTMNIIEWMKMKFVVDLVELYLKKKTG